MADRKISELPDHGSIRGGDVVPANRTESGITTTGRATMPTNIGADQGAYYWRAEPTIAGTGTAGEGTAPLTTKTAIPDSGDGYKRTIVAEQEFEGPIQAGFDFWTFWEGTIEFEITDNNRGVEIDLRTIHKFGANFAKELNHVRSVFFDATEDIPVTVPMAIFNSISMVRVGNAPDGKGGMVEITIEDLAGPSKIIYEIEIKTLRRRTRNRQQGQLDLLTFSNIHTLSYQLRQSGTA